MNRILLLWLVISNCTVLRSQDSLYTRQVLKFLTSEKCFGRGYLNNGLEKAEKFIVSEIKKSGASALFTSGYTQTFRHDVNVFPSSCRVELNGRRLKPGIDFIPHPSSMPVKGEFKLRKTDSTHFITPGGNKIAVSVNQKLTFGVSTTRSDFSGITVLASAVESEPQSLEINMKSKLIAGFRSSNIGCYFEGRRTDDTMIVFSAHYDHLGGICGNVYFPGANDNASGVSVLLNLIRYCQVNPPEYKTVFLFFAAEEAGLLGSKFFVESGTVDLKKIKFLINLDLLGTGDEGIMVVNGAVHETQFALLSAINTDLNLVPAVRKRGKAANSDHHLFSESGVPCFFIYTLGGSKAYHDVYDIEATLPLTEYRDVFRLITTFVSKL